MILLSHWIDFAIAYRRFGCACHLYCLKFTSNAIEMIVPNKNSEQLSPVKWWYRIALAATYPTRNSATKTAFHIPFKQWAHSYNTDFSVSENILSHMWCSWKVFRGRFEPTANNEIEGTVRSIVLKVQFFTRPKHNVHHIFRVAFTRPICCVH